MSGGAGTVRSPDLLQGLLNDPEVRHHPRTSSTHRGRKKSGMSVEFLYI